MSLQKILKSHVLPTRQFDSYLEEPQLFSCYTYNEAKSGSVVYQYACIKLVAIRNKQNVI